MDPGHRDPTYHYTWQSQKTSDGKYRVTLHVTQRGVPDDSRMAVPILIVLDDGCYARTRIWVDEPEVDLEQPVVPLAPCAVRFNKLASVLCGADQ